MSLIGGVKSGVGGVRTTGGESAAATPPVTGIQTLTSTGGTITITDPTGPTTNVEVTPTPATDTLFDLVLSYGHGLDIDANLPASTSFWFSPTTIADLARADQVREWVTTDDLGFIGLDVRVDAAALVTAAARFIVTVNGLDTAIGVDLPLGATSNTTLSTSALFAVAAGSRVGVRFNGSSIGDGSTLRAEIRLRAATTGTPFVPDTLPVNPLALFRGEDLALDGTSWVDSVAGNLYTLTVPNGGPPPFGYLQQVTGPVRTLDGSFNGHPYAAFSAYHNNVTGLDYTVMMLRTHTPMFAGTVTPLAPRTFAAVLRPSSIIGGTACTFQVTTRWFVCALEKQPGHLQQAVYYNNALDAVQTDYMTTPVNLAGNEIVCIWRTDGTTIEFFINGVRQSLTTGIVGNSDGIGDGFSLGNQIPNLWISQDGWQGGIVFGGVWARNFTDDEVLSATANLAGMYVTP